MLNTVGRWLGWKPAAAPSGSDAAPKPSEADIAREAPDAGMVITRSNAFIEMLRPKR